jgi:hypothetical protein
MAAWLPALLPTRRQDFISFIHLEEKLENFSLPFLDLRRHGLSVSYRPGTYVQALSQDKKRGVHPHTTTCPATPYPASQSRWALGLPRVQRLRNPYL